MRLRPLTSTVLRGAGSSCGRGEAARVRRGRPPREPWAVDQGRYKPVQLRREDTNEHISLSRRRRRSSSSNSSAHVGTTGCGERTLVRRCQWW